MHQDDKEISEFINPKISLTAEYIAKCNFFVYMSIKSPVANCSLTKYTIAIYGNQKPPH